MTNYRKEVKKYLTDLRKKGWQPGGGSAAALAFCLGVSLLIKSIRHSQQSGAGKEKIKQLISLSNKVFPCIDRDGKYFSELIASKGKKREYNLKRTEKLTAEIIAAAQTASKLAKEAEPDIKKSIQSDFCLGQKFIEIAVLGVKLNSQANLKYFGSCKDNR